MNKCALGNSDQREAGEVTVGIAVQDGNYDHIHPKTGKRVTVAELIEFATTISRLTTSSGVSRNLITQTMW